MFILITDSACNLLLIGYNLLFALLARYYRNKECVTNGLVDTVGNYTV